MYMKAFAFVNAFHLYQLLYKEDNQRKMDTRMVPPKKNKAKKHPQRGLGVAQLEHLRILEQQNNNMVSSCFSSSSSSSSSSSPNYSSFLAPRDPGPLFKSPFNSLPSFSPIAAPILNNQQLPVQLVNREHGLMSSSSGLNVQIEPPSLQNYNFNPNMHSSLPNKDMFSGMNTQWPFQIPFRAPFRYERTATFSSSNSSKEGGSSSGSSQIDWQNPDSHSNKRKRENVDSVDNVTLSLGSSSIQLVSTQSQGVADSNLLRSMDSRRRIIDSLPLGPIVNETDTREQSDDAQDNDVDTSLKL